jgi:hypothetical protein
LNCELGFRSGLNVQVCQAKFGLGTAGESWQGTIVVIKVRIKIIIENAAETITLFLNSIAFLGSGNL